MAVCEVGASPSNASPIDAQNETTKEVGEASVHMSQAAESSLVAPVPSSPPKRSSSPKAVVNTKSGGAAAEVNLAAQAKQSYSDKVKKGKALHPHYQSQRPLLERAASDDKKALQQTHIWTLQREEEKRQAKAKEDAAQRLEKKKEEMGLSHSKEMKNLTVEQQRQAQNLRKEWEQQVATYSRQIEDVKVRLAVSQTLVRNLTEANSRGAQAKAELSSKCEALQATAETQNQRRIQLEATVKTLEAQLEAAQVSFSREGRLFDQVSNELRELKQQLGATSDANCIASRAALHSAFNNLKAKVMFCARALNDSAPPMDLAVLQPGAHFEYPDDKLAALEALLFGILFQGFDNESFTVDGSACFQSKTDRCAKYEALYIKGFAEDGVPPPGYQQFYEARTSVLSRALKELFPANEFGPQSLERWAAATRDVYMLHLLAMAAPVMPRLIRRALGDPVDAVFCEKAYACSREGAGFVDAVAFMICPGLCLMDEVVPGLPCQVYLQNLAAAPAAVQPKDEPWTLVNGASSGQIEVQDCPGGETSDEVVMKDVQDPSSEDRGPMEMNCRPESPESKGANT
jgi:hypothetical protein